MKFLLPIILLFVGVGAGSGAGFFFKAPEVSLCTGDEECEDEAAVAEETEEDEGEAEPSYVAMKNQFVVPVVRGEKINSLVVLSLSLETDANETETVFAREPKLRDAFLRTLFDHAHAGGFDGAFTESGRLTLLRVALLEVAQDIAGKIVKDILITDIVRQEM